MRDDRSVEVDGHREKRFQPPSSALLLVGDGSRIFFHLEIYARCHIQSVECTYSVCYIPFHQQVGTVQLRPLVHIHGVKTGTFAILANPFTSIRNPTSLPLVAGSTTIWDILHFTTHENRSSWLSDYCLAAAYVNKVVVVGFRTSNNLYECITYSLATSS